MIVRPAQQSDVPAIAALLAELGYSVDSAEIQPRLERLSARSDGAVIVADSDGQAVGLAAYQFVELLHRPRAQCRITALVVDAEHRRRGVASALVAEIQKAAEERDCYRLEVTTQPGRDQALALYAALGFQDRPVRLVKPLE